MANILDLSTYSKLKTPYTFTAQGIEYEVTENTINNLSTGEELIIDQSIAKSKLAIRDLITTTNPANQALSYIYLYTLAHTGLSLPDSILFDDPSLSPKVFVFGGEFTLNGSDSLLWIYPDGGIPVVGNNDLRYVPMASKYAVNINTGNLYYIPDNTGVPEIVELGHNRTNYLITTDTSDTVEMSKEKLIIYAMGKYNETNYKDPVVYLDNDPTNLTPSNLTLDRPDISATTVEITDHPRVTNL